MSEHNGYIKVWRHLCDDPIWTAEKFSRGQAWVDLLVLANHKDSHIRIAGQRIEIKRGEAAWSEVSLAKRWKWSRGKVRRFLAELESEMEQKIVQRKTNVTSLIQILNYDKYQGNGTADSTPDGHPMVHQTDTRWYTDKNEKNEKNTNTPLPPKGGSRQKNEYSKSFEDFWSAYPNKVGKDAAYRSWKKIGKRGDVPAGVILAAIVAQVKAKHFNNGKGEPFIPNPATWLNQGRWKDEIKNHNTTTPTVTPKPYEKQYVD